MHVFIRVRMYMRGATMFCTANLYIELPVWMPVHRYTYIHALPMVLSVHADYGLVSTIYVYTSRCVLHWHAAKHMHHIDMYLQTNVDVK